MTVLRELIAKLGFQVDGEGWKKAERAVEDLKRATAADAARAAKRAAETERRQTAAALSRTK